MAYGLTLTPAFIISPLGNSIANITSDYIEIFSLQCIRVSSKSNTTVVLTKYIIIGLDID